MVWFFKISLSWKRDQWKLKEKRKKNIIIPTIKLNAIFRNDGIWNGW